MIDVSSLPTAAHAAIALLIERSGNEGRRVKELVDESPLSRPSISRILAELQQLGFCLKVDGEVPRYCTPSISPAIPSVSPARPSPLVSCEISVQERNSKLKKERKKERKRRNLLTLMRKRRRDHFRRRMYLLS